MTLTVDDVKSWGMVEEQHINGGADFFGYIFRCNQQHRLSRYDRYDRKDRSVTSIWRVDGKDVESLQAAIDALNIAPIFSPEEIDLLATISDEPEDRRKEMVANFVLWDALKEKAAIIWEKGRCRRSETGRATLAEHQAEEL